jgi:hypothetical protein
MTFAYENHRLVAVTQYARKPWQEYLDPRVQIETSKDPCDGQNKISMLKKMGYTIDLAVIDSELDYEGFVQGLRLKGDRTPVIIASYWSEAKPFPNRKTEKVYPLTLFDDHARFHPLLKILLPKKMLKQQYRPII